MAAALGPAPGPAGTARLHLDLCRVDCRLDPGGRHRDPHRRLPLRHLARRPLFIDCRDAGLDRDFSHRQHQLRRVAAPARATIAAQGGGGLPRKRRQLSLGAPPGADLSLLARQSAARLLRHAAAHLCGGELHRHGPRQLRLFEPRRWPRQHHRRGSGARPPDHSASPVLGPLVALSALALVPILYKRHKARRQAAP